MRDREAEAVQLAAQSTEVMDGLRAWVRSHAGIVFAPEQEELFDDRIESLCRALRTSPLRLLARVRDGDHAYALRLVEAASTNYTFFFREPEVYAILRDQVLPELGRGRDLRIWSAACSSGDEAYSLAIQARESFGEEALSRVRILGTDISERQLRLAEEAVYPRDQILGISPQRLSANFSLLPNARVRVNKAIHRMCTFRRLNLTQTPWPFALKFHVIFLRNVLYYFEPAMRKHVLDACHAVTEPGGYLFTSLTEPMIDVNTRYVQIRPAVFQRVAR
jgi:chemotaxis protein methyltransferase CheR